MGLLIRKATEADAARILEVTREAFTLYRSELSPGIEVTALTEGEKDVINDIKQHSVYVAEENGKLLGSIRYEALSAELAYIYRFGVLTDINNTGIGSELLSKVIEDCITEGFKAIALHTNSRYYKLARYYYGKQFFVHSTSFKKGYIRALFVKELRGEDYDVSPALLK